MGIKSIREDWSRLFILTDEACKNLRHIERNPIYRYVVSNYANDRVQNDEDPYGFHDVLYWLDYEANMDPAQNESPENWAYSIQAIHSINRWLLKYYPDYAKDAFRPWGFCL